MRGEVLRNTEEIRDIDHGAHEHISATERRVGSTSACEAAFRDAADGRISGDEEFDLDPAMRACRSLREWSAASRLYPEALDGVDPRTVAENRCLSGRFSSEEICRELGITP